MSARLTRSHLEEAGWILTARGRAMGIAELEYEAVGMDLKARHDEEKDAVYLTLTDAGARSLTLKVPADEHLADALALVVDSQDQLDGRNYGRLVNGIVTRSPGTQGVRDGELVELEPE